VRTAVLNRAWYEHYSTNWNSVSSKPLQGLAYSKYFGVKSLETAVDFISLLFHQVDVEKVLKQNLF